LIGTDINKENREAAINEILKEVTLLQSSINLNELELAKRHFIGSLQGEIASPFSILGKIKNIELNQLPDDYYQNLISEINSITGDELSGMAKKYFAEDSLYTLSVG
jgi:predicted Zn-dependent peptidase